MIESLCVQSHATSSQMAVVHYRGDLCSHHCHSCACHTCGSACPSRLVTLSRWLHRLLSFFFLERLPKPYGKQAASILLGVVIGVTGALYGLLAKKLTEVRLSALLLLWIFSDQLHYFPSLRIIACNPHLTSTLCSRRSFFILWTISVPCTLSRSSRLVGYVHCYCLCCWLCLFAGISQSFAKVWIACIDVCRRVRVLFALHVLFGIEPFLCAQWELLC